MQEIPVYLFNGFLESGKTTFIQDILSDPNFTEDERSLVILCEEGIEEIDEQVLAHSNATVVTVEDKSAMRRGWFRDLGRKYSPDRVLIEFNGMWELEDFIENYLPPEWPLYQIVATVNAETFELYANNMGPRMFEHLTTADLIVFNRCTDELKDMLHKRNIRAMNPRATIFLDDVDGGSEDYRDNMELPFDIDAPVINISDEDFGLWYVDIMSNAPRYKNKNVRVRGMVYRASNVPAGYFVISRRAMTCCADDIAVVGILVKTPEEKNFADGEWVEVCGEIISEKQSAYKGTGPVLVAREIAPTEKAESDLVYFN